MRERPDAGSASVWRGEGDAPPICSSPRARSGSAPSATARQQRNRPMPYTPTGRPVGRPKTKDSKTISLKMPQDLLDRVQRYAREHGQSVSALIREGLEWRMTEGAPRRQPAHGQRSSRHTAFDELAQPVHLLQEGRPFDEGLAGGPHASSP